jgi:uncharacterized protein (DUF1015 family)
MTLLPFRALRYDSKRVDLASVVAPPYDVIDERHQGVLYERSPHNVVRLILNRDTDRHASAAGHLADWTRSGLLRRDAEPALWLYVQNFQHDQARFERTGIIGVVPLAPFESGRVRPHERTLSAPKEDRMRLLQACQVNLSPIFGLYSGRQEALAPARRWADRTPPTVDLTDEFGIRHRTWKIADPDGVRDITTALEGATILIADGHHRYETALAHRDHLQATRVLAPDDPANFIMMYLCGLEDPGLLVLPTHRVLRRMARFDAPAFVEALRRDFEVRECASTGERRHRLLAELEGSDDRVRFGVIVEGLATPYIIRLRDDGAIRRAAPELPQVVRQLDVTILDRLILRGILGLEADAAARTGQLSYSHDAAETLQSIDSGKAQMAFLLSRPDLGQLQAVCSSGETMPQKSTYFYPKLLTGLLFHPLSQSPTGRALAVECARTA